jgi:hypothetical protein
MPAKLRLLPGGLTDNGDGLPQKPPSVEQIERELHVQFAQVVGQARSSGALLAVFEKALWTQMLTLGRLLMVLFLASRQQRQQSEQTQSLVLEGRVYRPDKEQPRNLNTLFGVVRYFRMYLRASSGAGHYPLDAELGLTQDRLSFGLLSMGARLATRMSFAKAQGLLRWFLGQAPSTQVLEQSVLGLGRRTHAWFEQAAPPPEEDGEVLIIQADSKGAPTATESELERRRRPRNKRPRAASPRHRGRQDRKRRGKKPRRKKGDKSKNARLATAVVMYTLRKQKHQGKWVLCGPLNRWTYASFAPKRHAFAIARREADRRGFTQESGRVIQVLTDGDEDLACYTREYFPTAIHTVDVMHVIEYLHKAGECLYREGSPELAAWVEEHKNLLYGGQEALLVAQLRQRLAAIPQTGPGNKGRRDRLGQTINYLNRRLPQMNYQSLLKRDLEIGTGIIEGTVKNLIGARFDFGGSRWIRERAEALLQLRCIDHNGHWDAFIQWVHDQDVAALRSGARIRIQQSAPAPLPTVEVAA